MIKKLKRRFIVLAMVSLAALLAVIVTGMNIVNYQKVVSDADSRLEVLQQNSEQLLGRPDGFGMPGMDEKLLHALGDEPDDFDDNFDMDNDDIEEMYFGRGGRGGPSMSQDEAEEARFFTVCINDDGSVSESNITRISAVDTEEAEEYAEKAIASGKDKGFVDDFRFAVDDDTITFLDCGRVLDSFRDFLKYSVLMSLLGLLFMFAVITYFAGRIVKPVAESYEKQKRFITDAGHEIKTPLAIIKANIDVMEMDIDSGDYDDLRDSLGDIDDQVDRLTGLTNDLVYLSRMEESESSLVLTELPFSDIVTETVTSFEPLAAEKDRQIEADIAPDITIKGSHKELEKLISILMENAVKYSAPGPINVSLQKDGKNAVLEVQNRTENELTNESLSHVFERFYRTDSSRNSETGGHGIGLSMASAIVAAHGGKISARTTDGHDFVVTASIPL